MLIFSPITFLPEAATINAGFKNISLALPDVTLRLDLEGVIQGANLANSVSSELVDSWFGRPWAETVQDVTTGQVRGMVADARANGVSDFRVVRQRFPSGLELPMEYNTVRLGGDGGLIAIGKNLQAVAGVQSRLIVSQHAREQESWKLREVETRNRLLSDSSDQPILLLRADDFSVVEANPAAFRAGALDAGRDFRAAVACADQEAFRAMMAQVAEHGRARGILLHIGAASAPWLARASRAAADSDSVCLLRLSPAVENRPLPGSNAVEDLIEQMPEGFVVVDEHAAVRSFNRAFLDLVQVAAPAAVIGQPIGRWLSRPGADAAVLMATVRRHRTVRNFATSLVGDLGAEVAVEIAAVAAEGNAPRGRDVGVLVHDVSRRAAGAGPLSPAAPSLAKLSEQIGRTKLLDLVRETSDLVERHCIETALDRAGGNRTAAAGLLGLSRQSLYAKLARYGIGGIAEGATAD